MAYCELKALIGHPQASCGLSPGRSEYGAVALSLQAGVPGADLRKIQEFSSKVSHLKTLLFLRTESTCKTKCMM
jgi:hypothetical protein